VFSLLHSLASRTIITPIYARRRRRVTLLLFLPSGLSAVSKAEYRRVATLRSPGHGNIAMVYYIIVVTFSHHFFHFFMPFFFFVIREYAYIYFILPTDF